MGFFGEIVTNDKVELPIPEGYILKILTACLSDSNHSSILFVQTAHEENGFALCNLSKRGQLQSSLQHEFGSEDSPIVFWTTGDSVHLTGNWIWNEDDDDEDDDEEEDTCCHDSTLADQEQEKEDEDEEELQPQKQQQPKQQQQKQKQKEKEQVEKTTSAKRSRTHVEETSVIESSSSKKQKNSKENNKKQKSDTERIIASKDLVVISKPPSDTTSRAEWKVKPLNGEGTLIPSPKQKSQSGVLVSDYVVGHGAEPKLGATVGIIYEGLFPDGRKFDANLKRSKPLKFRKGSGQVIRGLDLGLEGMRIGGSREIVIPAALGYGAEGFGEIPGNQTLVFRVTLVGVDNKRK